VFGDMIKGNLLNWGVVRGIIAGRAHIIDLADSHVVYNVILQSTDTTGAILFKPVSIGDMDLSILDLKTSEYQLDLYTFVSVSLYRRSYYPRASASITLPAGATGIWMFPT